jgi:hypothetical protein
MKFFIAVIGMAMFIEGLPYFLFPNKTKEAMAQIQELSPRTLKALGFLLLAFGLLVTYLSKFIK